MLENLSSPVDMHTHANSAYDNRMTLTFHLLTSGRISSRDEWLTVVPSIGDEIERKDMKMTDVECSNTPAPSTHTTLAAALESRSTALNIFVRLVKH